jgi:hypothetical protein
MTDKVEGPASEHELFRDTRDAHRSHFVSSHGLFTPAGLLSHGS